jgi:hypothetical protein
MNASSRVSGSSTRRSALIRDTALRQARKIDRRTLAAELGIAMNTLRIKAFRIRQRLSACVFDCAKKRGARLK